MRLTTDELIEMKGKVVKVLVEIKKEYFGIIENLVEASAPNPSNLIASIIIDGKIIDLPKISNLELID